ncbi:nucleoside 2-deoxyribosyltransferase [Jeotgalibacillus sp. R-1-5s-1]|uniref:nucleoside 2-deoxyribosyltransferase n=1 Tax=Jeotgalibacillus sp. R-1-5s-1 TaxID=2555897 RepID=UPI00106C435E|nr:nucleoside 2-deoxyribosyltransferase [Jeotgalibacillus sp. R-1-5s-1]TFE00860.1 group-specific protein [Jeotgalibacillus sp. R-1-5s-1]
MKFYIASGFQNKHAVQHVSQSLKTNGWIHTYDWTKNERASSYDMLREIGELERDAVLAADLLIVLLPGGKGTLIEMGLALAQRKKIYLVAPDERAWDFDQTSTFYHLPEVEGFTGSVEDFIFYMLGDLK